MEFSVAKIQKVSRIYQNQSRIAELNKKSSVKGLQSQQDKVSLSPEARQMAEMAQANPRSRVKGLRKV